MSASETLQTVDSFQKYSGNCLGSVISSAEKAVKAEPASSVNSGDGCAILHKIAQHIADWSVIATLRNQLADTLFEDGDLRSDRNDFWWELGDIQEAMILGKTRLCRNCGEMEGVHQLDALYCRRQRWYEGPQVISYRFEPVSEASRAL